MKKIFLLLLVFSLIVSASCAGSPQESSASTPGTPENSTSENSAVEGETESELSSAAPSAPETGEDIPGGEFSIGEYFENGYRNSWMGLEFRGEENGYFASEEEVRNLFTGDNYFGNLHEGNYKDILEQKSGGAAFLYRESEYSFNSVSMEVHVFQDVNYFADSHPGEVHDAYKYIEVYRDWMKESTIPGEFIPPVEAVLGGRNFVMFEERAMGSIFRYYVQEVDGYFLFICISASEKNFEEFFPKAQAMFYKI